MNAGASTGVSSGASLGPLPTGACIHTACHCALFCRQEAAADKIARWLRVQVRLWVVLLRSVQRLLSVHPGQCLCLAGHDLTSDLPRVWRRSRGPLDADILYSYLAESSTFLFLVMLVKIRVYTRPSYSYAHLFPERAHPCPTVQCAQLDRCASHRVVSVSVMPIVSRGRLITLYFV